MPKYFHVRHTIDAIVEAKDAEGALITAKQDWRDIKSDGDPSRKVVKEMTTLADVEAIGWDSSCLPYGGDGVRTLQDLLPAE